MSKVMVWGKAYYSVEALEARIAENDAISAQFGVGPSDDRVTENNALREAIENLRMVEGVNTALDRIRKEARATYFGPIVTANTGTTHFVNSWGETFCGRYASEIGFIRDGDRRATCKVCRRAGDAALRDGTECAGGSAARRN